MTGPDGPRGQAVGGWTLDEVTDILYDGDDAVVLVGEALVRVGGLAPMVLSALAAGALTREAIMTAVITEAGPSPVGRDEDLLAGTLAALADYGIVVPGPAAVTGAKERQ